jgi:hypothetical protein
MTHHPLEGGVLNAIARFLFYVIRNLKNGDDGADKKM